MPEKSPLWTFLTIALLLKLTYQHQHNQKKHLLFNTTDSDTFKQARGILSPYHIFLENIMDLNYFAKVKIQQIELTVEIDINIPFTIFINQTTFVKEHPSLNEIQTVQNYFPEAYKDDIFIIPNDIIQLNSNLEANLTYFVLIGKSAEMFHLRRGCQGFLSPQFLTNTSFSLYFGNDPSYMDSVLYLGGYEQMFLVGYFQYYLYHSGEIQEITTYQKKNYTWCFPLLSISIFNLQLNDQQYDSCIDSIYSYIETPKEIISSIKFQLEKINQLTCYYEDQQSTVSLLTCRTKLPLFEVYMYPNIQMNFTKHSVEFTAYDYIYDCSYDVKTNYKKCTTIFAKTNKSELILGLPFLRNQYSNYETQNATISNKRHKFFINNIELGKASQLFLLPQQTNIWFYILIALLIFWSLAMISCGYYYKEQMNQLMIFVHNILKYMITRDQEARQQLIMGQLMEDN